VIAPAGRNEMTVDVVEMEVAGQLLWRWIALKPAISLSLFIC
jgi:hypothetical protein